MGWGRGRGQEWGRVQGRGRGGGQAPRCGRVCAHVCQIVQLCPPSEFRLPWFTSSACMGAGIPVRCGLSILVMHLLPNHFLTSVWDPGCTSSVSDPFLMSSGRTTSTHPAALWQGLVHHVTLLSHFRIRWIMWSHFCAAAFPRALCTPLSWCA